MRVGSRQAFCEKWGQLYCLLSISLLVRMDLVARRGKVAKGDIKQSLACTLFVLEHGSSVGTFLQGEMMLLS